MQYNKEICQPLTNLNDILKYVSISPTLNKKLHHFSKHSLSIRNYKNDCHQEGVELQPRPNLETRIIPKTLVCHDMKGGYLEDKFVNGCDTGNGYTFYRWPNIDIFVYFSHHLVTIPPVGWIDIAHRNNVKILGTVITELEPGKIICDEILKSETSWKDFAKALVNICISYSFDGWLLNIENEISDTQSLVNFIDFLTAELHNVNSEFVVLWYDSVTKNGELKWQNELNDLNKSYFDVCDGIFVNYTWKDINLVNSVKNAEDRVLDVFIGVDVFGRGCFGGGGFNTCQAVKLIRDHNLSLALFAQGWTHETLKTEVKEQFYDQFCSLDNAFWLKIYPYMYTRPIEKCFTTTFYFGSDKNSFNLHQQELSLSRPVHCGSTYASQTCLQACDCIQLHTEGCKPNTISYLISKNSLDKNKDYVHRLFSFNIKVGGKITIATVTKEFDNSHASLRISVLLQDANGKYFDFIFKQVEHKINWSKSFEGVSKDWNISHYILNLPNHMKLLEVGVILDGNAILLGGFAIKTE